MPSFYWIKLYHEILDDPKMGRLPDRTWRRCVEIFLLAGDSEENGNLPPIQDIAWRLRADLDELKEDLETLEEIGILAQNDGAWHVVNFVKRQEAISSTERVREFRKRQRAQESWRMQIYNALPEKPGIYLIGCTGDDNSYIGASKNIRQRVKAHLTNMATVRGHPLHNSLSKYGAETIYAEVLEVASDLTELPALETKWIQSVDELANSEKQGKPHRDWNEETESGNADETQRNAEETYRSTDIDTDKNREEKKREDYPASQGADAPPSPPEPPQSTDSPSKKPKPPPLTPGAQEFLRLFSAKRFANAAQRDAVLTLESEFPDSFVACATWAAEKGVARGQAISMMRTALPTWGQKRKIKKGDGAPPPDEPAGFAGLREVAIRHGLEIDGLTR